MRLGGPVFLAEPDPERWIAALREQGYRAAYCPATVQDSRETVRAYVEAAAAADIVIAEVGAWSNPLSPDPAERAAALEKCQQQLALADAVGARCCVNIAGSRGTTWDGPHPDNLTAETFEMIVEVVRQIIDAVKPTRTHFSLEPMPWMYPDSADSYLELIAAIDRPQFAAHLDPVNWISSPQRFFRNGNLIEEWLRKLGPHIVSCHAKDITLAERLTVHLDEVRPGLGQLDYRALLRALDELPADTPLMLEHLPSAEEYVLANQYVRAVAAEVGVIV